MRQVQAEDSLEESPGQLLSIGKPLPRHSVLIVVVYVLQKGAKLLEERMNCRRQLSRLQTCGGSVVYANAIAVKLG